MAGHHDTYGIGRNTAGLDIGFLKQAFERNTNQATALRWPDSVEFGKTHD